MRVENRSSNVDASAYGESVTAPSHAGTELPTVAFAGDPAATLAAVLVLSDYQDRGAAREIADIEERARVRAGEAQVRALHDKADAIRMNGWVKGLTTIASAALDFVATMNDGAEHATQGSTGPTAAGAPFALASKLTSGVGALLAASYDADAIECDNRAGQAASEAEGYRAARDRAQSDADSAQRSAERMLEATRDLTTERNVTMQAALIRG